MSTPRQRAHRIPALANFVLFQGCWFAAILGAAAGMWWAGPAAGLLVAGLHLASEGTGRRLPEAGLLLTVTAAGIALDALVAGPLGVMVFHAPDPAVLGVPLWMAALWLGFATTLNNSLAWLRGRYLLAAVAAAVAGPLAYLAGYRLGALAEFAHDAEGLAIVGLEWAIAMPLVLILQARITPVPAETDAEGQGAPADRAAGDLHG